METRNSSESFSTAGVARQAGVHRDTLLRWLRAGLIPEPSRDRHGWRAFTEVEAKAVASYAQRTTEPLQPTVVAEANSRYLARLRAIDWDFAGAKTTYLTHGLHPYPAKFIPQIPNALIQGLSSVGDTVADIFCGSGTTLVEALTLKRNTVGIDANPLACLISRAKTTVISEDQATALYALCERAKNLGDGLHTSKDGDLFSNTHPFISQAWRPKTDSLTFWFEQYVIEELAECLSWCRQLRPGAEQIIALTAFSAIVIGVSKQDSDTRYVRRDKDFSPGEVFRRFARTLQQATRSAAEFSELVEPRFSCEVLEANILSGPAIPMVDLVVSSPPYPNAYSYHLYHMTRMLWLEMDQPRFKREEIGSHRKYSSNSKSAASPETFRQEFEQIMGWMSRVLRKGGYACFVVGDSTVKGKRIDNTELISNASKESGFLEVLRIDRTLQSTKKSFNPTIGKIKTEKILILQNVGGIT